MNDLDFYEAKGYLVLNLSNTAAVLEARERLLDQLKSFTGWKKVRLENYHEQIGDDDNKHTEIQAYLTDYMRRHQLNIAVLRANMDVLLPLVGPDSDIWAEPYLRIVRPMKAQDNIGYHRDTIYGTSPYEISALIPFVDLDSGAALCLEPASHRKADSEIPFTQAENQVPAVMKGSVKHHLGFLYAPKVLHESYPLDQMIPIPIRVGQILIFTVTLLHGTILNSSPITRWSCDARVKNAFLPAGDRGERFIPLGRGPATKVTEQYLRSNQTVLP